MREFKILFFRKQAAVLCLAVAALCVVVARACLQSMTLDESSSYLSYARMSWPSHWYPSNDWKLLQISLFICLVYNPFVLDYLVAARGYSLAVGFLLAGIAAIASAMLREDETELHKRCVLASILLALSFASNFSFAIADGMTLLVFFLWVTARKKNQSPRDSLVFPAGHCSCVSHLWLRATGLAQGTIRIRIEIRG